MAKILVLQNRFSVLPIITIHMVTTVLSDMFCGPGNISLSKTHFGKYDSTSTDYENINPVVAPGDSLSNICRVNIPTIARLYLIYR